MESVSSTVINSIKPVIQAMINFPDELTINSTELENAILFCINCNDKDKGRLIGRNGSRAAAIRTLVDAICFKHNRRSIVEIRD